MKPHFKVSKVTDLKNINDASKLEESDFSLLLSDDKFVQFELVAEKVQHKYKVKPGIYAIARENNEFVLNKTSFTKDKVLDEYVSTKVISDKINKFFDKIDIYKDLGIFPKRAALLYGSPGCGKSVLISKIAADYTQSEDTTVVIWPTDKYEARHVKDFIQSFEYDSKIQRFILIMEDLGGVEMTGRGKMVSDASLLSLLDNVERTFSLPTMVLATTNFPENFLENLTDRPQRFDDVIEIKRPAAEFRAKFLKFFAGNKINITEAIEAEIVKKDYEGFSIAHIKECVIRALIYDIDLLEAVTQVKIQSAKAKSEFIDRKKMGIS